MKYEHSSGLRYLLLYILLATSGIALIGGIALAATGPSILGAIGVFAWILLCKSSSSQQSIANETKQAESITSWYDASKVTQRVLEEVSAHTHVRNNERLDVLTSINYEYCALIDQEDLTDGRTISRTSQTTLAKHITISNSGADSHGSTQQHNALSAGDSAPIQPVPDVLQRELISPTPSIKSSGDGVNSVLYDIAAFIVYAGDDLDRWKALVGQRVIHSVLGRGTVQEIQPRAIGGVLLIIHFVDEAQPRRFTPQIICNAQFFTHVDLPIANSEFAAAREQLLHERKQKEFLAAHQVPKSSTPHKPGMRSRIESVPHSSISPNGILPSSSTASYVAAKDILHRNFPRLQQLNGPWQDGWALDLHTISSVPLDDGYFDTVRTDLGELLYRLKYRRDASALHRLTQALSIFVSTQWGKGQLAAILPIPPSDLSRRLQPLPMLAHRLGQQVGIEVVENYLEKVKVTPVLKNIDTPDERRRILEGAFRVHDKRFVGKHVLLLDDLYRSGTTLRAVTEVLIRQGGLTRHNIHILTITRTRNKR